MKLFFSTQSICSLLLFFTAGVGMQKAQSSSIWLLRFGKQAGAQEQGGQRQSYLFRHGYFLRAERELLLLHKAIRHVVALHVVFLGEALSALDRSAEQVIQERVVRRVVTVDGDLVGGMMPVMEIRRDDHVLQRSPRQMDIGLVKHRLVADDDDVGTTVISFPS